MTPLRARAITVAGAMAWPAAVTSLAVAAHDTLPPVVDGSASPDDAVAAVAALSGLAVLGWLGTVALLAVASQVAPEGGLVSRAAGRLERAITPAALRRFVALAVAGALVSGAAPAQASTRPEQLPASVLSGGHAPLDPGWFPADRVATPTPDGGSLDPSWVPPVATAPTAAGSGTLTRRPAPTLDPSWGSSTRARPGAYPQDDVVVRRGDTLWDIAARHLGPSATDAEIAQAWPQWFTANRAVIGPDPDRLVPGQLLHPPASRPGGPS
jgi:nucleoid-associated protein YgaU